MCYFKWMRLHNLGNLNRRDQYFINNGICTACSDQATNCLTCLAFNICTSCTRDQYFLNGSQCISCGNLTAHCTTCSYHCNNVHCMHVVISNRMRISCVMGSVFASFRIKPKNIFMRNGRTLFQTENANKNTYSFGSYLLVSYLESRRAWAQVGP